MVAAGFWIAVFDFYYWLQAFRSNPTHNDFVFYYLGAKIGISHGWSSIYDASLQDALYAQLRNGGVAASNLHYVNPPPLAWMVAPLTSLPVDAAYVAWTILNLAALALAWWLVAPDRGVVKAAYLFGSAAIFPIVWCFVNGEVVLVVGALLAASAWCLRRRKDVAAGILIGLAVILKPTLVFLVPPVLIVCGRRRAGGASVVIAAAGALVSAISLGFGGISEFRHVVSLSSADPLSASITVRGILGSGPLATAAEVLLAVGTLFAAWRLRNRESDVLVALGILGSALATPYLHSYDLSLLVIAAWLLIPVADRWLRIWLAVGVVAAGLAGAGITGPVILFELVLLSALALPRSTTANVVA